MLPSPAAWYLKASSVGDPSYRVCVLSLSAAGPLLWPGFFLCPAITSTRPEPAEPRWDLGYMGTYSEGRQPPLDRLMLEPARLWERGRFVVAGPQYPPTIAWP